MPQNVGLCTCWGCHPASEAAVAYSRIGMMLGKAHQIRQIACSQSEAYRVTINRSINQSINLSINQSIRGLWAVMQAVAIDWGWLASIRQPAILSQLTHKPPTLFHICTTPSKPNTGHERMTPISSPAVGTAMPYCWKEQDEKIWTARVYMLNGNLP